MNEPADTLADKHKARRQAFRRLTRLTSGEGQDAPEPAAPEETQNIAPPPGSPVPAAPVETHNIPSVLENLLQRVRAFPRRAWQQAGALWAHLPRRKRPASGEPEGPHKPGGPDGRPPRLDRFKAGTARAWTFARPILWRRRIGPAFWTVASLLSLTINIILIVILVLLGRQLFFLKKTVVSDKLINGLYDNFTLMDQAHIQTTITVSDTIQVNDTIPVVFDLPLNQKTTVVLTQDTPVNTTIYLNNTAVPLDLILRDGTELNIQLDITVPVKQTIPVVLNVPVHLTVPVDIPLDQTQLHKPFVGLQQVVSPYRQLLGEVPNMWSAVCKGSFKFICNVFRFK